MTDIAAFHTLLRGSPRILAIVGAGLSASSGLPTFRGAGGLWRNYESTSLATPGAFARDPALVWLFYAWRRHMCLQVDPNAGHTALAALAKARGGDFLCLTQNVDNLHERAGHPTDRLRHLHGRLFDVKCSRCKKTEYNTDDPLVPALAPASADFADGENPLLDPSRPVPKIATSELPHCSACGGIQRPGVVWFGENLDSRMLREVDAWIDAKPVDIVLVIGTSSVVYPAAGYADRARTKHTKVVTVNLDPETEAAEPGDLVYVGDAAQLLPELLAPLLTTSSSL
ncbi:NAD-dependent protein deacylase [Vanrija pseudolonga]|uniref:NAD-dependent protein deacylase n=1 Tax=Vanrija pseudolonga TaxID=143232 RepID=A0AAF1BTX3_9TREE|nr:NAD-dependent protein deacylase [Vanrija pseudolonga]